MATVKSSAEEFGREVYKKAIMEIRDSAPKIVVNIAIAVLVWVIGNYVFIPISQGYFIQTIAITQLINLIILIALAAILLMILKEFRDLADAGAGVVAYEVGSRKGEVTKDELNNYRIAFRGLLYIFVAAAAFLLVGSQLTFLHPMLGAVVLLVIVVWAIGTLFRVGRALSKTVEDYAAEWAKKLEDKAR